MAQSSVSKLDYTFDARVADQYEGQRAHPAAVSDAIGAAIAAVAMPVPGPSASILELGVGTGRMARPLAQHGCDVWGIDLSRDMLEITRETGTDGLHLCQADMHRLPFPNACFDAVLAVHVLHLATDVRTVLTEAVRTLRAGGWFVQGRDWLDPESVAGKFQQQLRRTVLELRPGMAPPAAGSRPSAILGELGGAKMRDVTAAEWTTIASPAAVLASIAAKTHAESWILDDDLLPQVVSRLTTWTTREWSDLSQARPVSRRFELSLFQGDWGK